MTWRKWTPRNSVGQPERVNVPCQCETKSPNAGLIKAGIDLNGILTDVYGASRNFRRILVSHFHFDHLPVLSECNKGAAMTFPGVKTLGDIRNDRIRCHYAQLNIIIESGIPTITLSHDCQISAAYYLPSHNMFFIGENDNAQLNSAKLHKFMFDDQNFPTGTHVIFPPAEQNHGSQGRTIEVVTDFVETLRQKDMIPVSYSHTRPGSSWWKTLTQQTVNNIGLSRSTDKLPQDVIVLPQVIQSFQDRYGGLHTPSR